MELWSCRNPLTIEERRQIKQGIDEGLSSREIGKAIGRGKSVIARESKRLGRWSDYDPDLAQKDFEKKQRDGWSKQRIKRRKDDEVPLV